jgi:hypothetical protein
MPSIVVDFSPVQIITMSLRLHYCKACHILLLLKTFSSGLNKAEEAFDLVMFAHPEIIHIMPTDCTGNYLLMFFAYTVCFYPLCVL